ncbi:hypothetical protein ACMD2_09916 [Ananas comosus]|uniref:tRNA-splicing endonuclease subunit Sen54 N-terminal domain-containing protein n=1 Tax=Ananas comosus TaxID=4615 RepID=A0A199V4Q1_ANACO|nr:hypothetical protein ACMD2_09916 [Ananas comosus]
MGLVGDKSRGRRKGKELKEYDEDDPEEHHHNPFLSTSSITKSSLSRPQFRRKEVSRARWVEEMGMGEVIEKKGSMWTTTGVVRNGKLYCLIEEIVFLAERGALVLLDNDDTSVELVEMYQKVADGKYGCSWESFEAYRHLKLLGYIVGRHGLHWTLKHDMSLRACSSWLNTEDRDQIPERETEDDILITHMLDAMQIAEIYPAFDVYLPNSKFKKSLPGDPSFILCLLRGEPPSEKAVENLEKKCNDIPLKFCDVDHGRVSFFSFNEVALPSLP